MRGPKGPLAVDTRKAVAVLAYLAAEGEQRRGALAPLLWPDSESSRARGALRRTLSVLRAAAGEGAVVVEQDRIALDRSSVTCDLWDVEHAVERARGHDHGRGACDECIEVLEDAADRYRGPFLEGFSLRDSDLFDEWLDQRRQQEERRRFEVLENLVRQLTVAHRFDEAIARVQVRLAMEPLHERSHQHLMLLQAWAGGRSEAVDQYRRCVAVLDRELGVAPLPETTSLYHRILSGQAPAPPATRAEAEDRRRPDPVPAVVRERRPPRLPLVGRGRELTSVLERYEVATEHGQAVAITGEAGIGKTRLAQELVRAVEDTGGATLHTRCHDGESGLPFAAIADLLRAAIGQGRTGQAPAHTLLEVSRLVPEVTAGETAVLTSLDAPGARARFLEAVSAYLDLAVAGDRPGAIVIDDLQWSDSSSVETVAYLLQRLERRRVLVCVTARPEARSPGSPAARALSMIDTAPWGDVVELGRLQRDDIVRLVERVAPDHQHLVEQLHRETEGVPFLLAEYLHVLPEPGLAWELPASVRAHLAARLATLPDLARQVLSAAAVIGHRFDADLLVPVSGRSAEEVASAVEALAQRLFVTELGEALDFAHEKLREAVLETLGATRRRLLHARVAKALAAAARTDRDLDARAATIAGHLEAAGDTLAAADHHRRAAQHARHLAAHEDALVHLSKARSLGHPDLGGVHEEIADALVHLGRYAEACAGFESAAAHVHDVTSVARIEQKLAGVHLRRGDDQAADAHLRVALDLLDHPTSTAARARVQADRALAALRANEVGEASALAAEALHLAQATEDIAALSQAHNLVGMIARRRNDPAAAQENLRHSLSLAQRLGDDQARVAAQNNLALLLRGTGDLDEARALLIDAVDRCRTYGDRHREAALLNNLADIEYDRGDREAAMQHLKAAVALFADVGEPERHEPEIWMLVEW